MLTKLFPFLLIAQSVFAAPTLECVDELLQYKADLGDPGIVLVRHPDDVARRGENAPPRRLYEVPDFTVSGKNADFLMSLPARFRSVDGFVIRGKHFFTTAFQNGRIELGMLAHGHYHELRQEAHADETLYEVSLTGLTFED